MTAPPATPGPPPPFPPNLELLAAHHLPTSWSHIVAGRFTTAPFSDLLFYDAATGSVELHATDGQGGLSRFASHNIGAGWTHLVTGGFTESPFTSLLLYDQGRGVAELHVTDGQGNLNRIRSYPDWGFWTHLTTVAVPNSDYAALVLYRQAAGHGEVWRSEGTGTFSVYKASDGWRTTWTHVVGDWWSGTSLLFYEAATGQCEIYTIHNDSTNEHPDDLKTPNNPADLGTRFARDGMPPATDVVAGNFGWSDTGFLFYDRTSGRAGFVFLARAFGVDISIGTESYDDWPTTWDAIVPGQFWEPDGQYTRFQNWLSDLFFYDRNAGRGEVWLHEPFAPNVVNDLEGFVSSGSVRPGETVAFHVNSRIGPFTIRIVRQGESEIFMADVPDVQWSTTPYPIGRLDYRDGPTWLPPAAAVAIPADWPSGLYLARLDGVEKPASATIPFVVRAVEPGAQSSILVMIPDTTYEAYNFWGGRSLYGYRTDIGTGGGPLLVWSYGSSTDERDDRQQPRAFRVSSRRPGAVDAGGSWPRWQNWEVPLFRWLARQGIGVEVCTATDVHQDQLEQSGMLGRYALVVSIGHDEYWSKEMRDNVEDFTRAGGNVAFLSGNVSWFQIRLDLKAHQQICYKDATFDPVAPSDPPRATVNWFDHPVCRAETALTGVSWFHAQDPYPSYWVLEPGHWVFNGVDDVSRIFFGWYLKDDTFQTVVGNETDRYQVPGDDPCLPHSPEGFLRLAETGGYDKKGVPDRSIAACTMGIWSKGDGQVFTAATLNWSLGLSQDDSWTAIDQITLNVLRTLGARWIGPGTLTTVRGLVAVAGHFSSGDGRHLVVVGRADGRLHEIYWQPGQVGIEGEDDLPVAFAAGSIVSVASFYDSDQQRHIVIVATTDGRLTELFWKADTVGIEGSDALPVAFAPGSIVAVSGIYDPDQQRYLVLVATTAGKVHEIFWRADTAGVEGHDDLPVAFAPGSIVGVSTLYNADDRRYVVVVGTTAGNVHEIFWKADTAGIEGHDDLPVSFPPDGIVAISGFYDRARQQHVVAVGTRDGTIQRMYWESTSVGIDAMGLVGRVVPDSLVGLAAFSSDTDGVQHIVAGQSNGVLSEWWINATPRSGAVSRSISRIRSPLVKPWEAWGVTDLTAPTGAPLTGGSEGLHAYAAGPRLYVTYLPIGDDTGLEVHQLEFDGKGWIDRRHLTALSGGPPAALVPPVGYTFSAQGTRHVIYLGTPASGTPELHVHELWVDGSGWHHNDLTDKAAAPLPVGVPPSAYVCDFDGTQHVDYIGEDGHVHELWWDHDGWHHHDLTAASGAPPAALDLGPASYMSNPWRTQHVDYIGADGRLHEIRWAKGSWTPNDPDGGPLYAAPAAPVGYVGGDGVQRVIYVASDNHLHELSFDGLAWDDQDASYLTGTLTGNAAKLAAYRADLTGTRHIIAIPEHGARIDDLRHDVDGWHYEDLATTGPSSLPDAGAGPAGFALASGKHWVFYTSIDFHIIALTWPSPSVLTDPWAVMTSRDGAGGVGGQATAVSMSSDKH